MRSTISKYLLLGDDVMKPLRTLTGNHLQDNSGGYTDDYTGKAPDQDILDIEKRLDISFRSPARTYQAPKRW